MRKKCIDISTGIQPRSYYQKWKRRQNEIILPKGTKGNIDKVFAGCEIKWVMNTSKGETITVRVS
jgi:hypothetical protein